jgi:CHAT domain
MWPPGRICCRRRECFSGEVRSLPNHAGQAEGLAGLNLDQLELAVLSACETGLGEAASGEGVLGLQRAFHLGGCRNLVASLWKVDDDASAAFFRKASAMDIQSLPHYRGLPDSPKMWGEPDEQGKRPRMRLRDYVVLSLLILIFFPDPLRLVDHLRVCRRRAEGLNAFRANQMGQERMPGAEENPPADPPRE